MSKGRGGREELPTVGSFRVEEVFPGEGLKPGGEARINLEEWGGGAERGPQRTWRTKARSQRARDELQELRGPVWPE